MPHIVKSTHEEGRKRYVPVYWCSYESERPEWCFDDLHHAAMMGDGAIKTCPDCLKNAIKHLEKIQGEQVTESSEG